MFSRFRVLALVVLALAIPARAETVGLSWDVANLADDYAVHAYDSVNEPTGSALNTPTTIRYVPGVPVPGSNPSRVSANITDLPAPVTGRFWFALKARNEVGLSAGFSNRVKKTYRLPGDVTNPAVVGGGTITMNYDGGDATLFCRVNVDDGPSVVAGLEVDGYTAVGVGGNVEFIAEIVEP